MHNRIGFYSQFPEDVEALALITNLLDYPAVFMRPLINPQGSNLQWLKDMAESRHTGLNEKRKAQGNFAMSSRPPSMLLCRENWQVNDFGNPVGEHQTTLMMYQHLDAVGGTPTRVELAWCGKQNSYLVYRTNSDGWQTVTADPKILQAAVIEFAQEIGHPTIQGWQLFNQLTSVLDFMGGDGANPTCHTEWDKYSGAGEFA